VVVVFGETVTLDPLTSPMPLSMLMLVALGADQVSVTEPPAVMVAAEAVNELITGVGLVVLPQPITQSSKMQALASCSRANQFEPSRMRFLSVFSYEP
jgi:hypothetical protein